MKSCAALKRSCSCRSRSRFPTTSTADTGPSGDVPGAAPCEPCALEAAVDDALEFVDSDELADVVVSLAEYRGNAGGGGDATVKG